MYEQIFHHWRKGEVLLRGNGAASTRPTGAGGRKRIKIAQRSQGQRNMGESQWQVEWQLNLAPFPQTFRDK